MHLWESNNIFNQQLGWFITIIFYGISFMWKICVQCYYNKVSLVTEIFELHFQGCCNIFISFQFYIFIIFCILCLFTLENHTNATSLFQVQTLKYRNNIIFLFRKVWGKMLYNRITHTTISLKTKCRHRKKNMLLHKILWFYITPIVEFIHFFFLHNTPVGAAAIRLYKHLCIHNLAHIFIFYIQCVFLFSFFYIDTLEVEITQL